MCVCVCVCVCVKETTYCFMYDAISSFDRSSPREKRHARSSFGLIELVLSASCSLNSVSMRSYCSGEMPVLIRNARRRDRANYEPTSSIVERKYTELARDDPNTHTYTKPNAQRDVKSQQNHGQRKRDPPLYFLNAMSDSRYGFFCLAICSTLSISHLTSSTVNVVYGLLFTPRDDNTPASLVYLLDIMMKSLRLNVIM